MNPTQALGWAVKNSTSAPVQPSKPVDPEIMEMLFGKDDSKHMREEMAIITSPEKSAEEKLSALENFRDLIENIDNANNIESMRMWKDLISCLAEETQRPQVLKIIATAVKDNEKAKISFMSYNGLFHLLSFVNVTRKESLFSLSALMENPTPERIQQFESLEGKQKLFDCLNDGNSTIVGRVFMILGNISPDLTVDELNCVIGKILQSDDIFLLENSIFLVSGQNLSEPLKKSLYLHYQKHLHELNPDLYSLIDRLHTK